MKRYLLPLLLFLFSFFLAACTLQHEKRLDNNSTTENWMRFIETDSANWSRGADAWFLTGNAYVADAPDYSKAPLSITKINAPVFSSIKTQGDYQVQIFGTDGPNSVYLYGPGDAVSGVRVA